MIAGSAAVALEVGAVGTALVAALGAGQGVAVLREWNSASGSRRQLELERREELVAAGFRVLCLVQAGALFLFLHTVDRLSLHLTGAMCALGALGAHPAGWWALGAQLLLAAGGLAWLLLDWVDGHAEDFPLRNLKAGLAVALLPVALVALVAVTAYFGGLDPRQPVMCCSALLTRDDGGVMGWLGTFSPRQFLLAMGLSGALAGSVGAAALRGRGVRAFAAASLVAAAVAGVGVVGAVAPYFYEQPHHLCPFCMLRPEHGGFGYLLFVPLLGSTVLAATAGALASYRRHPTLAGELPSLLRWLVLPALLGQLLVAGLVGAIVSRSNLVLPEDAASAAPRTPMYPDERMQH